MENDKRKARDGLAELNQERIEKGPSVIHRAVDSGDIATLRTYIKNGTDVNSREDGQALWMSNTPLELAVKSGKREMAALLLDAGALLDDRESMNRELTKDWVTPIGYAARSGDLKMCQILVERGANVDEGIQHSLGSVGICKFFVASGADVNTIIYSADNDAVNYGGLLHHADSWDVARYLAGVGANPLLKDCDGETALDVHKDDPGMTKAIYEGMAAFEQQQLRANLPSVADEMRSQGLTQTRGRRL